LIAEKDGNSRRIQVKSATINKGGSYLCALRHGKGNRRSYDKTDCDFIILYAAFSRDFEDMIHDGYYIVPIAEIIKSKALTAVVFPAGKGKGNIMVCKWEKYKDDWQGI